MNIKVVATEQELQDAFYVRKQVFVEEQQVPLEEEIDQFEDEAVHVVLYDEQQPVGAGRFRVVDGYGKVERICVMPSHRKSGAGKIIMMEMENLAHGKDLHKLKLNAQTHAEGFYEKLGYKTVSGEFLDAGIPHVTMVKEL
ncbi:GNAT family N-acetyltransferase [Bacillus songklensis]|uniref:GNAT family N-acetyltransferase n=1 Tax=Bacillus songklensis TaxID=1069116 RepID=A0ABV8B4Z7_9BACI